MMLSALALMNVIALLAGTLARRRRGWEKRRGGLLKALAVATGIAAPALWLLLDWPLTGLSFSGQISPYVAAAFVANIALTFAYNIVKGKPIESVDA
jgi:hypothetical protein